MTYHELLKTTAEKKRAALGVIRKGMKGPCGFLVEQEIKKNPGSIAWILLAKEFCETLAENVDDFIAQTGDVNGLEAYEIAEIYMAYEDDDPELYELLPLEARLFDE